MSNTSKVILVTIIATCILLGLGYAAITNLTLNIAGTASATADSGNFKVRFTDNISVSDAAYVSATRTEDHTATIAVSGLTSAGQSVTATYEIKNESSDLSADLKVATTNSNTDYFKISSKLNKSSLIANESTTVLVTVELTKTPIDADVSATVGVNLTAMPVQPGEEGTSTGTNDYSETPTTVNEYGFYFDEAYIYNDQSGDRQIVVFHEDGAVEGYYNDILTEYGPPGTATYTQETVSGDGITADILNSKQIYYNNATFTLDEEFMDRFNSLKKNEYGFYFEQAYSVWKYTSDGRIENTVIFYEDGSIESYYNGMLESIIQVGMYSYEDGAIYSELDESAPIATVMEDGRVIGNDIVCMALDPTFFDRYSLGDNNYYGVYLEEGNTWRWIKTMALESSNVDVLLKDDYTYMCRGDDWFAGISVDGTLVPKDYTLIGKEKESYGPILEYINEIPVKIISSMFKGCINLKVAPELPETITDMNDAFYGCTSLTTAPTIPANVTNMSYAFSGCTALEGEIEINIVNLEDYEYCFDGVDMSKIRLTGTASKEIKNLLGSTGENYTPIP